MTAIANEPEKQPSLLRRIVEVKPGELTALALSFAFFFCVLCAYYIVRPLRDEMAIALGRDFIQLLFTLVFFVMLAAVPLFGWVVARLPRAQIVPVVFGFFMLCLAGFWLNQEIGWRGPVAAAAFYLFVNIFALFVVSLFWSVMSDVWNSEQAKRVYGVVSVGGTAGALTGPLLIQGLIGVMGANNLLLLSIFFLGVAAAVSIVLRRFSGNGESAYQRPEGGSILAGAINVWNSPYLFRIALWIFAANVAGIYFYLEQARILGAVLPDQNARIVALARMETATSALTILCEMFVTAKLLKWLGSGRTLMIAPLFVAAAVVALTLFPSVLVIGIVMVGSRALNYGISNPAMRVLYTATDPSHRYRAQNFIDTVVQRGGNAASTWFFSTLAPAAGIAAPAIAIAAIPAALAWAWVSRDLGQRFDRSSK